MPTRSTCAGPSLLQLQQRSARYRDQLVLADIDLELRRGERVALLGKSGAGKSTLLSLIYRRLAAGNNEVALVPQQLGLVANLSAWHNIYMGRLAHYRAPYNLLNLIWRQPARRAEIAALASELELDTLLNKPAGELSGGQQQRVAIARALYSQAPIVLADEPVTGLDGPLAERTLALLCQRSESLVVALHDVAQARRYCDRAVGIGGGRVLFDCAVDQLQDSAVQALYGGDAPSPDAIN